MTRLGALLLEALIALAIFVMAGMAILSIMRQGTGDIRANRDRARGIDIARSTLAQIESGIATAESLDGPVRDWQGDTSSAAFEDAPPPETPWEVNITTQESGLAGLSRVQVRVTKSDRLVAEVTQLMTLVSRETAGVSP